MSRFDDDEGISLVEVLVTLMLLGITLTAFARVNIGGLRSLSESRARQTASQVATELIEDLRTHAPAEVAMYFDPDPLVVSPDEFDVSTYSCSGTPGMFDPDGVGPNGCETIVTNPQGVILATAPFQGAVASSTAPLAVATIATAATGAGLPAGTVRVTVVATYGRSGGTREVRRSALFSEVSRG